MLAPGQRPHRLLLFTAIGLSLLLVLLQMTNKGFQPESLFLVPLVVIAWAIPITLTLFWILYLLTKKFMYSKVLAWTHVLFTVFTAVFLLIVLYSGFDPWNPLAHRYYDTGAFDNQRIIGWVVRIVFVVLISGQGIYVVNVLRGLFIRYKNRLQIEQLTRP